MTCIGMFVEPPGSLAKFGPVRTLCCTKMRLRRLLIILTYNFLRHSSNRIGRVLFSLNCQSLGFGIRKICEVTHSSGKVAVRYINAAKERNLVCVFGPAFLINCYPMFDKPGADLSLHSFSVVIHSSCVGSVIMSLYIFSFISAIGA